MQMYHSVDLRPRERHLLQNQLFYAIQILSHIAEQVTPPHCHF
jgi:hypothetical protein